MSPDPFPGFLLSAQPCGRPAGACERAVNDAHAPPRIVPNSLSTVEHDVAEMLDGAHLLRRLAATPALRAVIDVELRPGPAVQSRDDMLADIRARASTVFHPIRTCRMGQDPRDAVVDARLRVHGIDALRVIDASVFPALTSGNTNAPTMMVAEKGADMILTDAR